MKIDSDDDSPLEKTMILHIVLLLIKSENHNHYYCHVFLEKCPYK